jgi:hypothetical protein
MTNSITGRGGFLRSPSGHREQAALLRKAGKEHLAKHHEVLATAIERRLQEKEPARAEAVRRIMDDAMAKAKAKG